jgi:hypothetical protein
MIQIEREEMKRRQDREDRIAAARIQIQRDEMKDLIANARRGSDDDGEDVWNIYRNGNGGYGGNEDGD